MTIIPNNDDDDDEDEDDEDEDDEYDDDEDDDDEDEDDDLRTKPNNNEQKHLPLHDMALEVSHLMALQVYHLVTERMSRDKSKTYWRTTGDENDALT